MTAVANREDFERAFSAATVHDMFNWCSVGVLFTIEVRDPLIQTWEPLCRLFKIMLNVLFILFFLVYIQDTYFRINYWGISWSIN